MAIETDVKWIESTEHLKASLDLHKAIEDGSYNIKIPKSGKEAQRRLVQAIKGLHKYNTEVQAYILYATSIFESYGQVGAFDTLRRYLPLKGGNRGVILDYVEDNCGVTWSEGKDGAIRYHKNQEVPINYEALEKGWWVKSKGNISVLEYESWVKQLDNVIGMVMDSDNVKRKLNPSAKVKARAYLEAKMQALSA